MGQNINVLNMDFKMFKKVQSLKKDLVFLFFSLKLLKESS